MKAILDSPMLYHTFQRAIGGFSARVKAINEYLSLKQGQVVVDIGCGPGHIAAHLPRGVDYHGFDIEPQYIEYAKRHFGGVAAFHCRMFDADAARTVGLADVVMMNGVLHHMDDSTVRIDMTASLILQTLKPGGTFLALDGVYMPDQTKLVKWLLDNDRGRFVRTEKGYKDLLSPCTRHE